MVHVYGKIPAYGFHDRLVKIDDTVVLMLEIERPDRGNSAGADCVRMERKLDSIFRIRGSGIDD
jgi:hypothetical protein